MKKKSIHTLGPIISLALFAVALFIIHHKLRHYHYRDIVAELSQVPLSALVGAVLLTVVNYLVLTFYDILGLVYIRHQLRYSRVVLASFIGYAFSNNATILGGSAARYRIYSALGVSPNNVARLVVFTATTFWLGFLALCGVVFSLRPQDVPTGAIHIPLHSVWVMGVLSLGIVCTYFVLVIFRRTPVRLRGWTLPLPSLGLSVGQIGISSLDWVLAAGVLYVLLPAGMKLGFSKFLAVFLLAQGVGLLSYIPGGLGVFETIIILLLSGDQKPPALVGSLVLYRLIYYVLPLVVASILLGIYEIAPRVRALRRFSVAFGGWASAAIPHIFAVTSFVAGVILLFSGALPAGHGRMTLLRDLLPLPAIEISHFLGSLAGAGLLVLAHGLQRRLDAAYIFTVLLLAAGVVLSVLKGLDYGEALILSIMLAALLPCRREFYRKESLLGERFTPMWAGLVAVVLVGAAWIGFFSYKHVEYSHQLWWSFAIEGDAPRFLRATTGAVTLVLLYALLRLLVPVKPERAGTAPGEFEKVETIVKASRKTYAYLALLGDKRFVFGERQDAFIMYAVQGRSWVAMGDPLGPQEQWRDLIWQYCELCEQWGGWPVFYEINGKHLELYLDVGMTFFKLGEEAKVPLRTFSLEGGSRKDLRHAYNKVSREGYTFEVVAVSNVGAIIGELEQVSNAWLMEKSAGEKGFSLGFFRTQYISRFQVAVVRKAERIVAFANIWDGAEKEELSVDLMRYLPESPEGIMDYLFVELLLWGNRQGYEWFNFGMAPLSGLEEGAMSPFWAQVGSFVFRHGEHFYNFRGLRQYKEKFEPVWEPKYLACTESLMLPRILANLASLISGGLKGTVMK